MVQCPSCEEKVDETFGMVTCRSCNAVFMVDFSGNVQFGVDASADDEEPEVSEIIEESSLEEITDISNVPSDPLENSQVPASIDSSVDDFLNDDFSAGASDFEETNDGEDVSDEKALEETNVYSSESVEEVEEDLSDLADEGSEVESFEDLNSSDLEEETDFEDEEDNSDYEEFEEELVTEPASLSHPDERPVDITEFANSEDSLLEDGEYLYTLTVSRLDSKELKNSFKYVLMDEKLKLDYNEYYKAIKNGEVSIPDLHPIKAKRIVEQLQFLDVEVTWFQKRVILEEVYVEEDEEGEYE